MRFIEVPRVDYEKLSDNRLGEPSAKIQTRVETARTWQRQRFAVETSHDSPLRIACNTDMRLADIRKYCQLDGTCQSWMRAAMNRWQLSARADHRVLKLASTVADLAGDDVIEIFYLGGGK